MTTDEHEHEDLPALPEMAPTDQNGGRGMTCPALIDGEVCGASMGYAHNVREYHPVRSWDGGVLWLGECNDLGDAEDENPHLWCTVGHDWVVPGKVEFE